MPGVSSVSRPVRSFLGTASSSHIDPGSEAAQRSLGVCSPSYTPTQGRHAQHIRSKSRRKELQSDESAFFGECIGRAVADERVTRSGRQRRAVVCDGQNRPFWPRAVSPSRDRLHPRYANSMIPGEPFYRRPSLERGLLANDDLSKVEALYVADAETGVDKKPTIPWQPVLFNGVLTGCLASFLFGYHVGVVNGPLEYIARDLGFAGSNVIKGAVVSATLAGAFIGSIGGGAMAERFGRRRTIQLNAAPLMIGAAMSAAAGSVAAMVGGRFMVGLGLGIATAVLPLYISEIAPAKYRGTMGALNQLAGCSGILVALLLSLPLRSSPGWWRTMFWIACVPAAMLAGGMAVAAESPRWLYKRGRYMETENTVGRLWGIAAVADAMRDLKSAAQGDSGLEGTWRDLGARKHIRVVAIGCAMFALQQLSGINAIFYFSSTVFHNAGVQSQFLANAGLGVVNLAGAVLALLLMDRWGRRKALRISFSGMAGALLLTVAAITLPPLRPWAGPLSVASTLCFVLAFCLGAGPVPGLLVSEMFPSRIRSRGLALCMACHWVFNFGIGLYFLEIVRLVSLPVVYTAFAAVALATVAFSEKYIVETQGKSLEEIERMLSAAH